MKKITKQFSAWIVKNQTKIMKYSLVWLVLIFVTFLFMKYVTPFRAPAKQSEFYIEKKQSTKPAASARAKIISIEDSDKIKVRLEDGQYAGFEREVGHILKNPKVGNTVLVSVDDGTVSKYATDFWRFPGLIIAILFFVFVVTFVLGRQSLVSLGGLSISILVIIFGLIPAVIHGSNALMASIICAVVIALFSVAVAHGFKYQTLVSLLSIYAVLFLTVIFALIFGQLAHLTGIYDETSSYLKYSQTQLDMRGILLGGIIIATLGALDDIVTTQTEAVNQIYQSNKKIKLRRLFKRGYAVGKEHAVALVNTLALIYVGAFLPLILSYVVGWGENAVFLEIINSEFITQEIIKTIVSSSALMLAVPIATLVASFMIYNKSSILQKAGIIKEQIKGGKISER